MKYRTREESKRNIRLEVREEPLGTAEKFTELLGLLTVRGSKPEAVLRR